MLRCTCEYQSRVKIVESYTHRLLAALPMVEGSLPTFFSSSGVAR